VALKRLETHSSEWAKLESNSEMLVKEFVEKIQNSEKSKVKDLYLFDWSLPLHCKALNEEFNIPSYFSHDFLKATSEGEVLSTKNELDDGHKTQIRVYTKNSSSFMQQ
jgi:hypothetical protein